MLPTLETAEPITDQVYKGLIGAITRCELQPGQAIPQEEIAATFGVSRYPVSHAIKLLRQQGLIEPKGNKGFAVSAVDATHIRDLYAVRGVLDGLAARLAARRVRDGAADASQLIAAADLLSATVVPADDAPIDRIMDAETRFHQEIYRLSGNPTIAATMEIHWPHLLRAMALIHGWREPSLQAHCDHRDIAAAIAAGDCEAAGALAIAHTERAGVEITSHLAGRA